MDRINEIDAFLEKFQQIYHYNPGLEISYNTIYRELACYGFTKEEIKNGDIRYHFQDWINRYSNSQNLEVYHSEKQNRFLQFRNRKMDMTDYKFVKLYLSYPKDKIYSCANKIFDFIEQNNFKTGSKIADCLRSDSIVLRMENIEDAKRVISFVNNDLELSQSAKKTNPFLVRDGVVGIAYDDLFSYNTVLSKLLEKYFKKCRQMHDFNKVSASDFEHFVLCECGLFRDSNLLHEFCEKNIGDFEMNRCGSVAAAVLNYSEIYKLISMSIRPNTMAYDVFAEIEVFKNKTNSNRMIEYYNALQKNRVELKKTVQDLSQPKQIIDSYIAYALKKYGTPQDVERYLNTYVNGKVNGITRDNGFRDLFCQYVEPNVVREVTNYNLSQYIQDLAFKQKESVTETVNLQDSEANCKYILDEYIKYAISKYGIEGTIRQLNGYLDGNTLVITRDCNFRKLFMEHLPVDKIYSIIEMNIGIYVKNIASSFGMMEFYKEKYGSYN